MTSERVLTTSDLQQRVTSAGAAAQRRAAAAAAELAMERTDVTDGRIVAARDRLRNGMSGESPERQAVQSLTEELDEAAWSVQERVERGQSPQEEYLKAFSKARAAASMWNALDADPQHAAVEAIYEASHAFDDLESLSGAVDTALS